MAVPLSVLGARRAANHRGGRMLQRYLPPETESTMTVLRGSESPYDGYGRMGWAETTKSRPKMNLDPHSASDAAFSSRGGELANGH